MNRLLDVTKCSMILETRCLIFDEAELIKVFGWYALASVQADLPQGTVIGVKLLSAPLQISVNMKVLGAEQSSVVILNESKTIGAIIYFCLKQKIPISREAKKTLRIQGDFLIMDLTRQFSMSGPSS